MAQFVVQDGNPLGLGTGINYWERVGSPEESMEADQVTAQRIVDCYWKDRIDLAQAILPTPWASTTGGAKYLVRPSPWAHPDFTRPAVGRSIASATGAPYLFAKRVSIKPIGQQSWNGANNISKYGNNTSVNNQLATGGARLTVLYDTPVYDIVSDPSMVALGNVIAGTNAPDASTLVRYVSRRAVPAGEFLNIPGGTYKWVLTPTPAKPAYVAFGTPKLIVHASITFTWHQVPQVNVPAGFINALITPGAGAIENALGKVNLFNFAGCLPGTMLLLSAEFKPIKGVDGTRLFDISYAFKFFMGGQNQAGAQMGHEGIFRTTIPNPSPPPQTLAAGWMELTVSGASNLVSIANPNPANGQSLYDWTDFAPLFRPF